MAGQTPGRPPPLLNWRDRRHWARAAAPCRHCIGNEPTYLRDDDGLPAHKVCAEQAIADEANRNGQGRRPA